MDPGAVTPVITAELTGGEAHLTKQLPGDLFFYLIFFCPNQTCTKTNQGENDIFKATFSASHQMGQSNEESCQKQVSLSKTNPHG